jgi:serine/threonine-protein kinase HipA
LPISQGKLATIDNAYAAKERFGLSSDQANSIIDRVWHVVRQWKMYFEEFGISSDQIEGISRAFRHIDDISSPKLLKAIAKGQTPD